MLQRSQTLWLLLSTVLTAVCLFAARKVFLPLSVLLILSAVLSLATIFMYRNRRLQSRFCLFNILLLLGGYVVLAAAILVISLPLAWSSVLPLFSAISLLMARRGILADERLIRSADRIR